MGAVFSGYQADSSASSQHPGSGLGDLPESCVALILSFLEPVEICRLAILNRTFRQASSADCVWEPKLPPNYKILINKLFQTQTTISDTVNCDQNDEGHHAVSSTLARLLLAAKKDIYARLCCPNRIGGDAMEVWMDKVGGGLCAAISWKRLKITGITDRRYWNAVSTNESRFRTIAYLKQIWWLQVEGDLEMEFPAGSYSLYFRVQLGRTPRRRLGGGSFDGVHGWNEKPVHFQLSSSTTGHRTTAQYYLNEPTAAAAGTGGGGRWIHYHVGDFVVDKHSHSSPTTKLKFSMTQIDCTHTKGGLCLDCALVYPTSSARRRLGQTRTTLY